MGVISLKRFLDKVSPEPNSGCWLWTAAARSSGYGAFWLNGHVTAHRAAWQLDRERKIPPGKLILHRCNTKLCVNPDHLYCGTHADNLYDAIAAGVHHNAVKTHCKNGHPFSGDNLVIRVKSGGGLERVCLRCRRRLGRRWVRKKREHLRKESL